jgi:hypothetical protein
LKAAAGGSQKRRYHEADNPQETTQHQAHPQLAPHHPAPIPQRNVTGRQRGNNKRGRLATAVAAATEVPDEPGLERTAAVMANIRFEGAFGSGGSGAGAAAPAVTAEPASTINDIEPVKKGTTKKPTGSKPQRVDVVPALRLKELKDFYLRDVRPFLNTNGEYVGNLSLKTESNRVFGQMRKVLPVSLHATVQELEDYCEERRQFAQQKRLHGWLHNWLMLHIPFTIALYVFMAAHIIIALRVVPWSVAELKALFGQ